MKKKPKRKVMVFGTFDIIHPGHLAFLREAKRHGNFLIVSVARDTNVKRIKGHTPIHSEHQRVHLLKTLRIVDRVVLGSRTEYLKHIVRETPDIICLGYDQSAYTERLQDKLEEAGLHTKVIRLRPYHSRKYKSSKILNQV
jgi:FAD synthetase